MRMARCGSVSAVHLAVRWSYSSASAQLLDHTPGSSLLKVGRRHGAALCVSWEQRSSCGGRKHYSGVAAVQAQQLGIGYRDLNDEQLAAVQTKEDLVRVAAGPGSGKTLVLTRRIAHLIGDDGVDPSNVLCLTFTNKAKGELLERLQKLLGESILKTLTVCDIPTYSSATGTNFCIEKRRRDKRASWLDDLFYANLLPAAGENCLIGTFHGIGAKLLREVVGKTDSGVFQNFAIYDVQDSEKVVKKMLAERLGSQLQGEGPLPKTSSQSEETMDESPSLRSIHKDKFSHILKVKEFELRNFVAKQKDPQKPLAMPAYIKAGLSDFNRYQNILRSYNAVDFEDLIQLPVRILYQRRDLRQKYQNRWLYILADEFQDTDEAQLELLKLLSCTNTKLFVVGDVDQAIYGFRGADHTILGNLERQFPGLATFELCRNYRSSSSILKLASEVMSRSDRSEISLRPLKLEAVKPKGPSVKITECNGPMEEVSHVLDKIRSLMRRKDTTYASFAILYRTNLQGKLFEQMCLRRKIPYTISGSIPFLDFKIIKDLRAYLQYICCPDDGVALERIINTPPRGLGPKTLEKIEQWASNQKLSLSQALQKILKEETSQKDLGITHKARLALLDFCRLVENLEKDSGHLHVSELIQSVMERTQLLHHEKKSADYEKQKTRVAKFKELAESYEYAHKLGNTGLHEFLETIVLGLSSDEEGMTEKDAVTLSTLHSAKGLEFDNVFIVGAEEKNIPMDNDLEGERRLFYVGVTRARKNLFITWKSRAHEYNEDGNLCTVEKLMSRFLDLPSSMYSEEKCRIGSTRQSNLRLMSISY